MKGYAMFLVQWQFLQNSYQTYQDGFIFTHQQAGKRVCCIKWGSGLGPILRPASTVFFVVSAGPKSDGNRYSFIFQLLRRCNGFYIW